MKAWKAEQKELSYAKSRAPLDSIFDGTAGELIKTPDIEKLEIVNIGALYNTFYIGVKRIEEEK